MSTIVKVLGVVFAIFVFAWGPFACANILTAAVCSDLDNYDACPTLNTLVNVLTWFGYVSCVVNPWVYNAFNENFRYAFKQILFNIIKCKCDFKSIQNKENLKREVNIIMQKMNSNYQNSVANASFNKGNKSELWSGNWLPPHDKNRCI